jgi:hypothetical protein
MPTSISVFEYKQRIAYNGSSLAEYIGYARPGPGTASPGTASPIWRLCKLTYSGTNVIAIDWANGNQNYDKVWDSRTGYTYN